MRPDIQARYELLLQDPEFKRRAERAAHLRAESLRRAEERDAEQELALRLIDIGYNVLRTGSASDALKRVRNRLKECA
jgi:hypothetical protein